MTEELTCPTSKRRKTMRWWYAYVPLLYAGSGGNRLIGKFQATEESVRAAFGHCATIEPNGAIYFYKRP